MEYYLKLTFLITQLVRDEEKKKRALRLARTIAPNDEALLEFLKKEGCITTGKTKEDVPCIEPDDVEKIDELIFQYFRFKEREWNNRFFVERN